MNTFYLYNGFYSPYFGVIIAIILLLPSILIALFFRPKNKIKEEKSIKSNSEKILEIVEKISRIAILVILCISKESFNIVNTNIFFILMLIFFILYYEIFIKYIINGCYLKHLYAPFAHIKVPMAVFPSLAIIFASLWGKNIYLLISSIIFAISHIYISYKVYLRNYTEYRDLYDSNRKSIGRKILKDAIIPKNTYYVTVIVFIYDRENKKWLMQKRSKDKGGKWASTSGHPISGQSSIDGMIMEIKEELGLTLSKEELSLITTIKRKDKFVDIYYLEKYVDESKLSIQKEELTEVEWMTYDKIKKLHAEGKYKNTHYKYFEELLKYIK